METLLHNKWIWGCVALLILEEVIRRGKPALKGAFGETIVSWLLSHLPKDQYKVIHNIMLKTERGTSQVDHVVVSIYGIFVIEVKNYNGWIIGTENSSQWTQIIYKKKAILKIRFIRISDMSKQLRHFCVTKPFQSFRSLPSLVMRNLR